jgi:hypothetical protein
MARVATKLTPTKSGGFTARKRIPEDVQADYERLYGVRWEARLSIAPGAPVIQARAQHREWLTDGGRLGWRWGSRGSLSSLRSDGNGRSLTPF